MAKLLSTIAVLLCVLFLYLGVFHDGLSGTIIEKGDLIEEQIDVSNTYEK